jgi:hypothetical protein
MTQPKFLYTPAGGDFGVAGGVSFLSPAPEAGAFLESPGGFPTVKYFRILSKRFRPIPGIASKSSTLLNGPMLFRVCTMFFAVVGPIPGTFCSSVSDAVLMLTGRSGGFFASSVSREKTKHRHPLARHERAILRRIEVTT